jgi:NADH-quinone oxidoreductase subunit F
MGSGKRYDLVLHRAAGAYICGEETALLDSLEGRRGQPRLRPPFPAVQGLFGCPTTVNNVESIAAVPFLLVNGADWFTQWGTEKSPGTKLMCISGEVKDPGNYEVPMGVTIAELLELAGGMLDGRELKFFCPGGSSTPMLPASAVDTPYTYEDIAAAGSLLGTGALMFYSDQTSVVSVVRRFTEFYEHESCGKCTPCREGGYWASQILARIEGGAGAMDDLEALERLCDSIFGRSFCALGDALTSPIASSLKYFRDEYVELIQRGVGPDGTAPARDVARMDLATVSGTVRYRTELAALAASAVTADDLPAHAAEVDA